MSWKRTWVVVGLAAGLAACGGNGKSGNVTVSAAGASPGEPGSGGSLDAGNGILIRQIRLVVRKLEVEGAEGASCTPMPPAPPPMGLTTTTPAATGGATASDHGGSGEGGGSDDGAGDDSGDEECEIEQGPFLVVLSGADLLAGTHPVIDATIPAGTYEEFALRIGPLSAEKAAQAPVEAQRAPLADLAARHVSVEVTGTMSGADFTFAAALEARQKREGAITVDPDTGADLTFTLDASTWFKAANGSKLDPTDPAMEPAILENIRASFRLVHDEDHDGADDDHDGHGGDDGSGHR